MRTLAGFIAASLIFCAGCSTMQQETAQGSSSGLQVPAKELRAFTENTEVAEWLVRYDRMAWLSSDLAMKAPEEKRAKLGPEWFCYEDTDGWHAIYGKLASDGESYAVVLKYGVDEKGTVAEEEASPLAPKHLALVRARQVAYAKVFVPTYQGYGVSLNPYVRRHGEKVEVWFAPAWQPDGVIAYGQTHRLVFSADGRTLEAHDKWGYGLRGIRPDKKKQINIGDPKFPHPTVGDIFFVLMYGQQFDMVMIHSREFTSTLIKVDNEPGIWFHCLRPAPSEKPKGEKTEAP